MSRKLAPCYIYAMGPSSAAFKKVYGQRLECEKDKWAACEIKKYLKHRLHKTVQARDGYKCGDIMHKSNWGRGRKAKKLERKGKIPSHKNLPDTFKIFQDGRHVWVRRIDPVITKHLAGYQQKRGKCDDQMSHFECEKWAKKAGNKIEGKTTKWGGLLNNWYHASGCIHMYSSAKPTGEIRYNYYKNRPCGGHYTNSMCVCRKNREESRPRITILDPKNKEPFFRDQTWKHHLEIGCCKPPVKWPMVRVSGLEQRLKNTYQRNIADASGPGCDEQIRGYRENGYRGCQNNTISGRTCQRWDKQSPHGHSNHKPNKGAGSHNYCRNPDGEPGGIWCYTTDPKKRWEYCDPGCFGLRGDETIKGYRENGYRGCQNKTKSGIPCQRWDRHWPHGHSNHKPNKGAGDHNYCRNPDGESGGIWCYTRDRKKRWEYCHPKQGPPTHWKR